MAKAKSESYSLSDSCSTEPQMRLQLPHDKETWLSAVQPSKPVRQQLIAQLEVPRQCRRSPVSHSPGQKPTFDTGKNVNIDTLGNYSSMEIHTKNVQGLTEHPQGISNGSQFDCSSMLHFWSASGGREQDSVPYSVPSPCHVHANHRLHRRTSEYSSVFRGLSQPCFGVWKKDLHPLNFWARKMMIRQWFRNPRFPDKPIHAISIEFCSVNLEVS